MRLFPAEILIYMCEYLAETRVRKETRPSNPLASALASYGSTQSDISQTKDTILLQGLELLKNECGRLDLNFSKQEILRIVDAFKKYDHEPTESELKVISQRMQDELGRCVFLQMPSEKIKYYKNETIFGKNVTEKFGDIAKRHIREAGNCYALDNNDACVYHLMIAMEQAVQKFGEKLKVKTGKKDKNNKFKELVWDNILNELKPKISAMSQRTKNQKTKFEKYNAIHSYLYAVKDAWRNPTMHPRPQGYNELEALNILNHVRSFMNELACVL